MISFFRNLFSSRLGVILAILFVGLIALAFALGDIQTMGGFGGGQTVASGSVATVEGEEITEEAVTDRLNRALDAARAQNPAIDLAAIIEAGALDELVDQMIRDRALLVFARAQGMAVSRRTVDGAIASIPAFQGLTGQFDEATFRQLIASRNLTEAQVREDLGSQAMMQQILGPVGAAVRVVEGLARPYAALLVEERAGQVAQVPSRAMPMGAPPSAEELAAYYQANLPRYTLPERRIVRYAVFSRDDIEVPAPTDAQIREYYTANSDRYGGTETRALRQVILPDEAAARAFAAEVAAGKSFEQAASERGFSEASTVAGEPTQSEFAAQTSPAIAQAAFAAEEGALTGPARSGLGWHVVRVVSIDRRAERSLATVRAEIVAALSQANEEQALVTYYESLEEQLSSGASFEEVARARGLEIVTTPPVSAEGRAAGAQGFTPAPELAAILPLAFTMEEGEDPLVQPLDQAGQSYALVDVTRIMRGAPRPLAEIRPIVTEHFLLERASARARAVAATIAARVDRGMPLAEAVEAAGIALPPVQPASASRAAISQPGVEVAPALRLMFRMAADTAKLLPLPDAEGWLVVVLDTIESNADQITPDLVQATQAEFAQVTAREYVDQFTNAVLADYEVARDEAALAALAARLTGR